MGRDAEEGSRGPRRTSGFGESCTPPQTCENTPAWCPLHTPATARVSRAARWCAGAHAIPSVGTTAGPRDPFGMASTLVGSRVWRLCFGCLIRRDVGWPAESQPLSLVHLSDRCHANPAPNQNSHPHQHRHPNVGAYSMATSLSRSWRFENRKARPLRNETPGDHRAMPAVLREQCKATISLVRAGFRWGVTFRRIQKYKVADLGPRETAYLVTTAERDTFSML